MGPDPSLGQRLPSVRSMNPLKRFGTVRSSKKTAARVGQRGGSVRRCGCGARVQRAAHQLARCKRSGTKGLRSCLAWNHAQKAGRGCPGSRNDLPQVEGQIGLAPTLSFRLWFDSGSSPPGSVSGENSWGGPLEPCRTSPGTLETCPHHGVPRHGTRPRFALPVFPASPIIGKNRGGRAGMAAQALAGCRRHAALCPWSDP
jgi:hypothetical protein